MQTLVPTAVRLGNLSGSVADLDDSPDSPDANWCENAAATPAWFTALDHKEWAAPVTNWLGATGVKDPNADNMNGQDGIIDEWSGMGSDSTRRTIFMLANGGHNGYYGNEVYSCDLSAESPAWTRRRDADYPLSPGVSAIDVAKNNYGNKTADHSCNLHIAAEGRWFTPGHGSSTYLGGAIAQQWWEFDPVDNEWIDLGNGHAEAGLSVAGAAFWDPEDRQIIVPLVNVYDATAIAFQSIDSMSSATPAVTNSGFIDDTGTPSGGVDTTNRVLFFRTDNYYYAIPLTNKTLDPSSAHITVTGTAPPNTFAMHWHPPSGAWITWDNSTGLRKLTPTVSGGTYTSAAWSAVSGAGGTTPPSASGIANLMYNKIQLMPMPNGDYALIVVPTYNDPDVYVMRLTGAV